MLHSVSYAVLCLRVGFLSYLFYFFQAEDGIRYLVRSRGLGDVYKRQQLLNVLGPRHIFGEMALLDDSPRLATIMTLTETLSLIHI